MQLCGAARGRPRKFYMHSGLVFFGVEEVVRVAVSGRLGPRRRVKLRRLSSATDLAIVKKRGRYWLRAGGRLIRVFFDDVETVDEALRGLWEVEGAEVVRRGRSRVLIRVHFWRRVEAAGVGGAGGGSKPELKPELKQSEPKLEPGEPKTVVRLELNGAKRVVAATVLSGGRVVAETSFKLGRRVADRLVSYVKSFEKPIIVCGDEIPGLRARARRAGIEVVEPFDGSRRAGARINVKPLLVGVLVLLATAALAMVYYSAFGVATITVEKKLDVSVDVGDVVVYVPGMGTKDIGNVTVTVYGADTDYRVILQLANLEKSCGIRVIAIQVYDGDTGELRGILTPITPSLIMDEYDEGSKTYELKLFYVAILPGRVEVAVQASAELM